MAGKYASTTGVTVDRSRAEVEQILSRYGATMFMYGWDQAQATARVRLGLELHRRGEITDPLTTELSQEED